MSRVCKQDGLLFMIEEGLPSNIFYQWIYRGEQINQLSHFGKFIVRNWEKLLRDSNFEIEKSERAMNSGLYVIVARNAKKKIN